MSDEIQTRELATFELWAKQLGKEWTTILKEAAVTPPKDARPSRVRMHSGGAPRVRKRLMETLGKYERKSWPGEV